MIVKQPDDKKTQLEILKNLLTHPGADSAAKKRIEREIKNIQAGVKGEAEAAYEMKVSYGESKDWIVIHDLRVEHGDLVAQVDHLIINRRLEMWVCESKHFSEGIAINNHGEFSAFFGGKSYGVPSPLEQNAKHILILKRIFDSGAVKLPTRLGITIRPNLRSLVLVSKSARISRPKVRIQNVDCIIKCDQLYRTIQKTVADNSPLLMARTVGHDTFDELTKEICKLHKPLQFNWAAKFGLDSVVRQADRAPLEATLAGAEAAGEGPAAGAREASDKPEQKLVCYSCGINVGYNVAKFCQFNKAKLGGNIYCMDCQKQH